MLLVCPKCVTQYEVDDQAIPENGREVQCANCEHIWFQDQLKMLSGRPASEKQQGIPDDDGNDGVFEDLTGVKDVEFHTARGETVDPEVSIDIASAEIAENILSDDFEDEEEEAEEHDDDSATELPENGIDVDDKILEVLRNEAAFSSARDQLDAAASDNFDGSNLETAASEIDKENEDADDLDIFLDALADDVVPESESHEAEGQETEDDDEAENEIEEPSSYDPLSDLDAIRRQLEEIPEEPDEETALEVPQEYQSILPVDDSFEDDEQDDDVAAVLAALEDISPETVPEDVQTYDDDAPLEREVEGDQPQTEHSFEASDDSDFDEFEETPPRRAFRADGAGLHLDEDIDNDDEPEDTFQPADKAEGLTFFDEDDHEKDAPADDMYQSGSAIPAAAALGAMRPRSSGSNLRARNVHGAEEAEPVADVQPLSRPIRPATDKRTARPEPEAAPAVSRKELLPDVEELNATLRNKAENPNGEAEIGTYEDQPVAKPFGRSFMVTMLILALFVALYVLKPMIVSALPATAIALDPYVASVDTIRLFIEQSVANLMG